MSPSFASPLFQSGLQSLGKITGILAAGATKATEINQAAFRAHGEAVVEATGALLKPVNGERLQAWVEDMPAQAQAVFDRQVQWWGNLCGIVQDTAQQVQASVQEPVTA